MRTRLLVLVGALLASVVLAGCSPREVGDVAVTLDESGNLVAVIRTCEDTKTSKLVLSTGKVYAAPVPIATFDGPDIKRRHFDFALAKPPKKWAADAPLPAKLDPAEHYVLEITVEETSFFRSGPRQLHVAFVGAELVPGQLFDHYFGLQTREEFAKDSFC